MRRRPLILAIKTLLIAGMIGYLAWSISRNNGQLGSMSPGETVQALLSGWKWIVLAQVLVFVMLALGFYRWKVLLSAQEIEYSLGDAMALGAIGFFFNQFIPGSTGGDLVKAYYVAMDHPERRAAGVTTVFLDRVAGLLVLVVIAGCSILFNWEAISTKPGLVVLSGVVVATLAACISGGVLFFSERVRAHPAVRSVLVRLPFQDLLGKIQAAVYVYKFHPRLVTWALFLSLIVQLSMVGMAICYAMALGGSPHVSSFFLLVPLAQLAMSVPLGLPGGLGQSEIAYRELFYLVGYPHGLELAIIQRLNWYVWALWGGFHYLRRRGRVERARHLALLEAKEEARPREGAGDLRPAQE